uniref:Transmembrane protein n=1 Tax=Aegilops tauschii subsp. strangulata TaxID=200361 RepID=A0A453KUR9_AEGTS
GSEPNPGRAAVGRKGGHTDRLTATSPHRSPLSPLFSNPRTEVKNPKTLISPSFFLINRVRSGHFFVVAPLLPDPALLFGREGAILTPRAHRSSPLFLCVLFFVFRSVFLFSLSASALLCFFV